MKTEEWNEENNKKNEELDKKLNINYRMKKNQRKLMEPGAEGAGLCGGSALAPRWLRVGSAVAPRWLRCGSAVAPRWLRDGSAVAP